jgi:hypothetical protein
MPCRPMAVSFWYMATSEFTVVVSAPWRISMSGLSPSKSSPTVRPRREFRKQRLFVTRIRSRSRSRFQPDRATPTLNADRWSDLCGPDDGAGRELIEELNRQIVVPVRVVSSELQRRLQHVEGEEAHPAGAIGLAQVMPAYSREFGKNCGVKDFKDSDLTDPELNLTIGACIFRALIIAYKGNLGAVLVAYNAGGASLSMKQLQSLNNITNDETPRYVTRFFYLDQLTKKM